jgi:hypothetical protein
MTYTIMQPGQWLSLIAATSCYPSDPPQLAGPEVPPEEAAKINPPVAMQYIGLIGTFVAGCTALHLAAIWAWQHCKWTAAKRLPMWMHPPAVELLLVNILGLPIAMYSVILLVQGQHAGSRLLGAVVGLAVLLYLFALVALLRLIFRNKPRLGLIYVPEWQPSSNASSRGSGSSRRWSSLNSPLSSSKLAPLWSFRSLASSRQGSLSGAGNSTAKSASGLTDVPSTSKLPLLQAAGPVAEGTEHKPLHGDSPVESSATLLILMPLSDQVPSPSPFGNTQAAAAELAAAAAAPDDDGGEKHWDDRQEGDSLQRYDTTASSSAQLVPLERGGSLTSARSITHGSWHMWQMDGEGQEMDNGRQGG